MICSGGSAVLLVFAMVRMQVDKRLIALIDSVAYRRNKRVVSVLIKMRLVMKKMTWIHSTPNYTITYQATTLRAQALNKGIVLID